MHDDHHHHGAGHNQPPRRAAQWQAPHRPEGGEPDPQEPGPDFDLVEAAFAEGFATASDPTSFLRMAGAPLVGQDAAGQRLCLLRVELDQVTDMGAITPHLGGGSFRYDPLPAKLVSRRRRLRLIYHDGTGLRPLSLGEAKRLTVVT